MRKGINNLLIFILKWHVNHVTLDKQFFTQKQLYIKTKFIFCRLYIILIMARGIMLDDD